MYNKLFSKIVTSSIWLAPDPARLIWITLLAMMDEDGYVQFASVANLAHTARVDPEQTRIAVELLESPDPDSGDKDREGRRIERVPGGWMVLNAPKYRALVSREIARERTRERVARFRAKQAGNADVTPANVRVTPSEAEADSSTEAGKSKRPRASAPPATRLPEDFTLSQEMRELAETERLDPERTFATFCDYWHAASGARARKCDWLATWRVWCRSDKQNNQGQKKPERFIPPEDPASVAV